VKEIWEDYARRLEEDKRAAEADKRYREALARKQQQKGGK
jgi:hypothetical protein